MFPIESALTYVIRARMNEAIIFRHPIRYRLNIGETKALEFPLLRFDEMNRLFVLKINDALTE